jgi:regulator of sigma E protease
MLVVLGVMVLVHELGHFAVAKWCGVRVEIFSIGFGKRLFGVQYGGTDYRFSALPFGGYVKMSGEATSEKLDRSLTGAESVPAPAPDDPRDFSAHPRWQRILIGLAGPAANFLLSLVLMTGFYMMHNEVEAYRSEAANIDFVTEHTPASYAGFQPGDRIVYFDSVINPTWEQISVRGALNLGQTLPVTVERDGHSLVLRLRLPNPRDSEDFDLESLGFVPRMQEGPISIRQVETGMPAAKAGLQPGDEILSVDGLALHSVEAMLAFLQKNGGRPVNLEIQRGASKFPVALVPVIADSGGDRLYRIGFAPNPPPFLVEQLPLPLALRQSIHFNLRNAGLILEVFHRMLTRRLAVENLSGPIGIARVTGLAVEQPGWQPIIGLTAVISLNLAILNLMPIPIMDGGMIVLLAIEGIMRRDLNREFKERIYQAAFVFLLIFFVFIMFNDISKLPAFAKLKL